MTEETPEEKAARLARAKAYLDNHVYENGLSMACTLTKLEYMSVRIMAGFASAPDTIVDHRKLATLAVDWATSLLYAIEDQ
jgi:hypothetical protein